LHNTGKVTAKIAKEFAENEYEKYKPVQDRLFESDFDKELKKLQIMNYELRENDEIIENIEAGLNSFRAIYDKIGNR
jgi:hypothetical protein